MSCLFTNGRSLSFPSFRRISTYFIVTYTFMFSNSEYELQEPQYSYGNDFTHKNSMLRAENTYFGMFILKKTIGWRGLDSFRDR